MIRATSSAAHVRWEAAGNVEKSEHAVSAAVGPPGVQRDSTKPGSFATWVVAGSPKAFIAVPVLAAAGRSRREGLLRSALRIGARRPPPTGIVRRNA
jgi:hypothetical protein